MLASVFEVEGRSNLSETFDEFCERLIGEFDDAFGEAIGVKIKVFIIAFICLNMGSIGLTKWWFITGWPSRYNVRIIH